MKFNPSLPDASPFVVTRQRSNWHRERKPYLYLLDAYLIMVKRQGDSRQRESIKFNPSLPDASPLFA